MLTLRCTAKMLKKLKCKPDPNPPASDTVLGDWFGNLFKIGRKEYFLFTNARTLLSVVTHAGTEIPEEFTTYLSELLIEYTASEDLIWQELDAMSPVTFAKTNNRSVLGSMNDFIKMIHVNAELIGDGFDPTNMDMRDDLCTVPMGAIDFAYPIDRTMELMPGDHRIAHRTDGNAVLFDAGEPLFDEDAEEYMSSGAPTLTVVRPDGSSQNYAVPTPSSDEMREDVREILQRAVLEDEDLIWTLQCIDDASCDPGGDLARIIASDPDENLSMHALLLLFAPSMDAPAPEEVKVLLRAGALPVLEEAMYNSAVPDTRKIMIGPLLARFGAEPPEDEYASCFSDLESAQKAFAEKMPPVSATPECATSYIESAGLYLETEAPRIEADDDRWHGMVGVVAHIGKNDVGTAAMILCATSAIAVWQGHQDIEPLRMAFDPFTGSDSPEALWQLEAFARWPYAGMLGRMAGQAAQEMRQRGIIPHHAFAPEFSHGLISMADGAGARQAALFFRTLEGGMDSILCLQKDTWGMKDCFPAYGDSEEVEEMFRLQKDQVASAPCTLALCREYMADAMALNLEMGHRIPPGAFLCMQYLGEEPLIPKRREPNLGAYMLEAMRRTPDMASASAKLMKAIPFRQLCCTSDAAYAFIDTHLTGRKRKLSKKVLEEFIKEICILDRDLLLQRMAVNLEVESLAGRATRKENKIAARTYLALAEEVVPFHEIPYIRLLAEDSVHLIHENLKMGYKNQDEANQTAMDMDEEMFEMFQQMLGGFGSDGD